MPATWLDKSPSRRPLNILELASLHGLPTGGRGRAVRRWPRRVGRIQQSWLLYFVFCVGIYIYVCMCVWVKKYFWKFKFSRGTIGSLWLISQNAIPPSYLPRGVEKQSVVSWYVKLTPTDNNIFLYPPPTNIYLTTCHVDTNCLSLFFGHFWL